MVHVCAQSHSPVQLLATPWTIAQQALLSMEFSWQEYWSGLPFPIPEELPHSGIKPTSLVSPALASGLFTISATWELLLNFLKGYQAALAISKFRNSSCL